MPVIEELAQEAAELARWRQDLHAHPEIAFAEHRTAQEVAARLAGFGIEVHGGVGKTGVVGKLAVGGGNRAIALRADMDALPMEEKNSFAHRSRHAGRMHACGHDGHTTMLLGAARHLARTRRFDGTVYFIFQPAEEGDGGAQAMIDDGLFERFPVEAVYGLHNWPGLAAGTFGVRAGPIMAASDTFEITVTGRGGHAAMPHQTIDPVVAAAQIITALQTIASRRVMPTEAVVVSVTQLAAGEAWNVIPDQAVLRGTVRALSPSVRDAIAPEITRIAEGIAGALGASARVRYERRFSPTVNSIAEAEAAAAAAEAVVGPSGIVRSLPPSMGAEDFGAMLERRPGAYVWLGNGPTDGGRALHSPLYDFNDSVLPVGASYWVKLVEQQLPVHA
ncbi:MAG: amidohydrolase [Alphaproteobacteria bacterium]|nr:amidohydrolase [Alphaproteobacteria bacterium]